jgi:hypothetical protein
MTKEREWSLANFVMEGDRQLEHKFGPLRTGKSAYMFWLSTCFESRKQGVNMSGNQLCFDCAELLVY